MTKLEQLLNDLCPDGVEYVRLGDICTITKGKTPIQKAIPGKYPLVVTTSERKTSNTYQFDGSAVCIPLVSSRGHGVASLNHVFFQSGKFALGNILCAVIPNDENKLSANFLYHYLEYKKDIILVPLMKGGANVSLHIDDIHRIRIPLPPIQIQNRTIEILEKFVELSETLNTELTARKKQYEYYRDEMLTFDTSITRKTLDEICNISAGGDAPKDEISKEKTEKYIVPIISNGIGDNALYGYTNIPKITEPAVTVAARGTIGYAEYRDYPYFPIIRLLSAIPKDTSVLNTRYLYYCLQGKEYNVPTSGIPQLTAPMLKKVEISVPSLEIQERIVNVLDNFEAICSDLQIGLPAEIEARKKQYEYYRDLLLSFDNSQFVNVERERERERDGEEVAQVQYADVVKLLQYVYGVVKVPLGMIGRISMCKRIMKSETTSIGDIPFYKIGTFGGEPNAYISKETFEKYKSLYSFPKRGDVLISAAGTIGRTVVYDGEPAYYQDSNIVWIDNDETIVLNSYLYYCYQLKPWNVSSGGTIARLYNDNIAKAVISVPPISEQKRIVSILDRFDKLCNDISEGLPAEIEARKKQYEYYRDKLLNFMEG